MDSGAHDAALVSGPGQFWRTVSQTKPSSLKQRPNARIQAKPRVQPEKLRTINDEHSSRLQSQRTVEPREERLYAHDPKLALPQSLGFAGQDGTTRLKSCIPGPQDGLVSNSLSTILMGYWFSNACERYSAYDSDINKNRQIASTAWSQSEAVFCAMQSMSAACLIDTFPPARAAFPALVKRALATVRRNLSDYLSARALLHTSVPVDSLFAIFALGTAVYWTATPHHGPSLNATAGQMLQLCYTDRLSFDAGDREDLSHFQKMLAHWDVRTSFASSQRLTTLLHAQKARLCDPIEQRHSQRVWSDAERVQTEVPIFRLGTELAIDTYSDLHPSTGVSSTLQEYFGLVICLCRDERVRHQRKHEYWRQITFCDITSNTSVARVYRDALHAVQIDEDSFRMRAWENNTSNETRDTRTPVRHLVSVAKAYRLAGLMHLYMTFPTLEIPEASGCPNTFDNESDFSYYMRPESTSSKSEIAGKLALELVRVLTEVPAQSGSRCIQPPLFVSAAAGLKYMRRETTHRPSCVQRNVDNARHTGGGAHGEPHPFFDYVPSTVLLQATTSQDDQTANVCIESCTNDRGIVSPHDWEVVRARNFILDRLSEYQRLLPPRPIVSLTKLIRAMWFAYDTASASKSHGVHWIDVMVSAGLDAQFS